MNRVILVRISMICFSLMPTALSAAALGLPSSVLPGQVSKSIKNQEQSQSQNNDTRNLSSIIEPKPSNLIPALTKEGQAIHFTLSKIVLRGNKVFTEKDLLPLYQSKLNKNISIVELFEIVRNITLFYRNNGYVLSRAVLPPQRARNGVIEVLIVEGYIDKASVDGHPHGAKKMIARYGEKIRVIKPLQVHTMERYLLLANEIPGSKVISVLSPSKTAPAAADLSLVTENRPLSGYVSYDNYGTRYIGPQQITANLQGNSLLMSGDSTQVMLLRTPKGKEINYVDVNYGIALNDEGWRGVVGYTRAATQPLFVLQPLKIVGLNKNYYANVQYPVIRNLHMSLTVQLALSYQDSTVSALGDTVYMDHLRTADLGMKLGIVDQYSGVNLIGFNFRKGLPILGYSSDPNSLTTSRFGGHADFTKITAQISRLQPILGRFSVYGLLKGQRAFRALLSSEQFNFGGVQMGRGYDAAEIIGDNGISGTLELRWDFVPDKFYVKSIEFYTFYDQGVMWDMTQIGNLPTKQSAASAGAGARFAVGNYVNGNLMLTQPITKQVGSQQIIGNGRSPRAWFSIAADF